jgi:hypothetical protein
MVVMVVVMVGMVMVAGTHPRPRSRMITSMGSGLQEEAGVVT